MKCYISFCENICILENIQNAICYNFFPFKKKNQSVTNVYRNWTILRLDYFILIRDDATESFRTYFNDSILWNKRSNSEFCYLILSNLKILE